MKESAGKAEAKSRPGNPVVTAPRSSVAKAKTNPHNTEAQPPPNPLATYPGFSAGKTEAKSRMGNHLVTDPRSSVAKANTNPPNTEEQPPRNPLATNPGSRTDEAEAKSRLGSPLATDPKSSIAKAKTNPPNTDPRSTVGWAKPPLRNLLHPAFFARDDDSAHVLPTEFFAAPELHSLQRHSLASPLYFASVTTFTNPVTPSDQRLCPSTVEAVIPQPASDPQCQHHSATATPSAHVHSVIPDPPSTMPHILSLTGVGSSTELMVPPLSAVGASTSVGHPACWLSRRGRGHRGRQDGGSVRTALVPGIFMVPGK